ncbi:MAG: TlyA family RNA methyltransferase, partial [Anaerolineaceae bacterium]|nr:TlyA family RNA methyltransferase [Anaerolineaceae bacterium]
MQKERLDVLLAERGLAESRSLAQRLIMAGQVRVDGQVFIKPATKVASNAELTVDAGQPFISRGGEKLEAGMQAFGLDDIHGMVCVDVGASTGGFTDCLLQHGAEKVYAIDVGYGILHWKMRNHPRVVSMERTNARYVEGFDEPVDLITMDASFIPLKILLPVATGWFGPLGGQMVVLVKPQFEAGRKVVAKGKGVVR